MLPLVNELLDFRVVNKAEATRSMAALGQLL